MGLFGNHARAGASAAGDYEIERSVRLNSADSANLTYTPGSDGNLKKFTFSFWFKKGFGTTGGTQSLFSGYAGSGGGYGTDRITIFAGGELQIEINGPVGEWRSKRLLRDPTAWYHIVGAFDTSQAAVGDRAKFYLNGTQITDWDSSYNGSGLTQDHSLTGWNNAGQIQHIGSYAYQNTAAGSAYTDGYYADFYFIDDQQLTPASFGETNADTGQWVATKYSGTYNSKSYFLNFKDNSGATSTTLGKDSSGNSNNFGCTNLSVAAGSGNDSLTDTPTNNFATLNPLVFGTANVTLANGSLDFSSSGAGGARSSIGMSSGKYYAEVTLGNATFTVGITKAITGPTSFLGNSAGEKSYGQNGLKIDSSAQVSYGDTFTTGDTISVAFDADGGNLYFYKNGTIQASGAAAFTGLTDGPYFFAVANNVSTTTCSINFGQRPFSYTIPTGYKALCTANLPTPTIEKASDHFNTVLYTGNGAVKTVTGVGFQTDLLINKRRDTANVNLVVDSVRGVSNGMSTGLLDGDYTSRVASFNADGFVSDDGSWGQINANGGTYVAWNWKESASAGLDIVTYTGNATGSGAEQTIAHNLGVVPEMIIVKARTVPYSGGGDWIVYHKDLSNASQYFLKLNTNDNEITSSTDMWNQTAPTASNFSVGYEYQVNKDGVNHVAYVFAGVEGFSKIGKYVGNGATDGVFVYTGFKPAVLIMKRLAAEDWIIVDNKRDIDNPVANYLRVNTDAVAADGVAYDFISNGVKFRGSSQNESGSTYVYIAFAERPFKYANAR